MLRKCLPTYVKAIAILDLIIAFCVYLFPFVYHVCKENGNFGCGVKNFHFSWGSLFVKNLLKSTLQSFRALPSNVQWLIVVTVLTINFIRMFWQSISLLRATILRELPLLKMWIYLEIISSVATYAIFLNPWLFSWGNVPLYSIALIFTSMYKIFSIFPVVLFKIHIQLDKNTSNQELVSAEVEEALDQRENDRNETEA